ncbi:MAG: metal ABC transporter substrate-binding protein [Kiritimatiellae bacterium]|nr:metal ABC transporter substrate-binding protein [Kiritimatiellia bacterium]
MKPKRTPTLFLPALLKPLTIFALFALAWSHVHGETAQSQDSRNKVLVTTHALQWVCETLAGDDAEVRFYSPDGGEEPPDFEKAALIVLNGAGFENWAAGLEADNVFRSSEAVLDAYSERRNFDENARQTFHLQTEGYTWLDPAHLRLQARAVAERMADFTDAEALAQRLQTLEAALDELERDLRAHPRMGSERFMALHPALIHFADGIGWRFRGPSEPLPAYDDEAFALLEQVREVFPARLAVAMGEPDPQWSRALQRRMRIHTFSFDPGTDNPANAADWPALMRRNLLTLTTGFSR